MPPTGVCQRFQWAHTANVPLVDPSDERAPESGPSAEALADPDLLDRFERGFWADIWQAPKLDESEKEEEEDWLVEEFEDDGFETRLFGPVQATVVTHAPRTPVLNVVLGAAEPGAVEGGHLAEALEWIESFGLDCRVRVKPGREGSEAAEDYLNRRGYRRTGPLARFVRDASPPDFPEPPGVEIDEWDEFEEGFSRYFIEGFGLEPTLDALFEYLPGRRPWRCYVAIGEGDLGVGAATMMLHDRGIAQFGLAASLPSARCRGVHAALLRRRILDAAAAGSRLLFADVQEPLGESRGPSPAASNLLRAGFRRHSAQSLWRPSGQ